MSRFNKESYARHAERHKQRVAMSKAARKRVAKQYVWDYLAAHPCQGENCTESDPRFLEFHHQDPLGKKYNSYLKVAYLKRRKRCQLIRRRPAVSES
jgi:hypothetical protein